MSDDTSDNELVPMQTEPTDTNDLFKDDGEFESQFEDGTAFTESIDPTTDARDAAMALLPPGDATFAQEILGVEDYREATPGPEEQHENIYKSVEDDLQPEQSLVQVHADTTMSDHHDDHFEPEQQAQRISYEPIYQDTSMQDVPNDMKILVQQTTSSLPVRADVDAPSRSVREDSTSLFVPERHSSSHSPAPIPIPPRLDAAPPFPARQLSMFARVRNMQKLAKARKDAYNRVAAATQPSADLDPETYLEAVTSGIRPPAGAYPNDTNEDEMAHRQALAEFQKQKRHYDKIKEQNNGRLSFQRDVEWMKIKGAEDARLKKRQRDLVNAELGDEQDLFPQVRTHAEEQEEESDDALYAEDGSRKRRRGEQPRKQTKPVSIQDAELQAMRVALDASDDLPKKKRKGGAGLEDTQEGRSSAKVRTIKSKATRPSRSKAAGKSAAKGPRKTAKDKRELERATKQATSLFNANVFEQQAGMSAADQPTFKTRNKAEALKELIASVPVQEKKQARSDMNTLIQASKDFDGYGSCKVAPGGNWMVKGMKTSLKGYQVLGSAFMRRRENDASEPRGGLMADQMGLGKTLMMLGQYTFADTHF